MADLHITSRDRTDRLTNEETVRLGRILLETAGTGGVSFPDDVEKATVIVHNVGAGLTPKARLRLAETLGETDERLVD